MKRGRANTWRAGLQRIGSPGARQTADSVRGRLRVAVYRKWTIAMGAAWRGAAALFVLLLTAGVFPAGAEGQDRRDKELIAGLDLKGVGANEMETVALTERLREVLLKTGRFTLVDRSQMEAILDEQALQQTGCTEQECAVQVGRILGVRKIIAGKVVKISEGAWLLSVMMVDVETAETVKVESIRHRGDYFTLLDEKMPHISVALAGSGKASQAAPAGAAATQPTSSAGDTLAKADTAPPTPPADQAGAPASAVKKLALFPALFQGEFADSLKRGHNGVLRRLERLFEGHSDRLRFAYSYHPTTTPEPYEAFKKLGLFEEVEENTWEGFFVKEPNERFIFQSGKKLGVDLVLVYQCSVDKGGSRLYQTFLFDVENLQVYNRSGRWKKGNWGRTMRNAVHEMIEEYRQATE